MNNITTKQRLLTFALILLTFGITKATGISTDTAVYNLFQAKCISCHNSTSNAGSLDLSGTPAQFYAAVVNHVPANTTAASRGDKLIKPGYTHSSFLLRKINNGLDPDNGLNAGEGNPCPQSGSLTNNNIELVRQWINKGAPQSGYVVDTNVINKFYSGRGILSTPASHPAPTAPGSFQIHIGRILLDSSSEMEYFQKYDLGLGDTIEVNRIELFMSTNSHHFILYKFINPTAAASFVDGMRVLDPITGQGSSGIASTIVSAWQRSYDFNLPATTAYSWPTGSVLDLNHHLYNYNPDSVLGVDLYLNVYTQPKHTAQSIMYSSLFYNPSLAIPANGQNITFTHSDYANNANNMWNIWFMSSHTHKYGVGFDIFERNPNNTPGLQLYDGMYDYTNNVNLGYFDWAHPPVELFSPMHTINPRNGLYAEATYNNTGPIEVYWGLTTKDEMMVYYIQYTLGAPLYTGIQSNQGEAFKMNLFPNPTETASYLTYTLGETSRVKIDVMNVLGENVLSMANETQSQGDHSFAINGLSAGTYLVRTIINSEVITRKLIITR